MHIDLCCTCTCTLCIHLFFAYIMHMHMPHAQHSTRGYNFQCNVHTHMHLQALPVSLQLLGEAKLLAYVPVLEQLVFLQRQGRQGGR